MSSSRRSFLLRVISLLLAVGAARPMPAVADPAHKHCISMYLRMTGAECICNRFIITYTWYCSICMGSCGSYSVDQGSC